MLRAVLTLLSAVITTSVALENDVHNSAPATGSEGAANGGASHAMFPTTNVIGMSIAILALITLIIIGLAAAHFGRKEKEREELALEEAKKLEVDRYEGARVYELTKIGV